MKNITASILATVAFISAVLLATYMVMSTNMTLGSVTVGNEYQANTVTSADVGTSSMKSTFGALGSIVVSSTSPASTSGVVLALYDTASTTIATTSMTAKVIFGTNGAVTPAAGTYTYDVAFNSGVYLWVNPSFSGTYTITYR